MNSNTNCKVFITGGTGKIGRHLVDRLLSQGFHVRMLTRTKNYIHPERDNLEVIEGDLLNEAIIKRAILGCDYIFHLAVYQNIADKKKDLFKLVNVDGTKIILDALKGAVVKKIVYVSTIVVFEATGKNERGEGWRQKAHSEDDYYAQTKIEALKLVRGMTNFLPITVVYPTAVIDLDDFSSSLPVSGGWQRFLWEKIAGGIPGGLVNLIGPKDRIFNYVIVEDLVEGIIRAAFKARVGEEYILGGENITAGDYLCAASARVKKRVPPIRIPIFPFALAARLSHFIPLPPLVEAIGKSGGKDMCFSCDKARKFLGYKPKLKL